MYLSILTSNLLRRGRTAVAPLHNDKGMSTVEYATVRV